MRCPKSDEIQVANNFSANKFAILYSVDFITETSKATEARKYSPRWPHVGEP